MLLLYIGYHTILPFPLHHCIGYVCIINYVDCLSLWWCRTLFRDVLAVSWSELLWWHDIVWKDHDLHETIWKLKHLIRKEHFLQVNTSESHLNLFFLMFFFPSAAAEVNWMVSHHLHLSRWVPAMPLSNLLVPWQKSVWVTLGLRRVVSEVLRTVFIF